MKLKRKICVLFVVILLAFQFTGCEFENSGYGTANVPPIVEQWRSLVEHYAEEYGIPEYVDLILAMIMQESGGNAEQTPDIMQCSESAGMSPNAIDDPEASIRQGVKYLASLVRSGEAAGVDRETVIQSYNFGGGYISFIAGNGGKHSEELARQYSSSMASRYGWSSYGDVKYVEHVYSHMNFDSAVAGEGYEAMYAVMKEYENVPYHFGGETKAGIDCSAMSKKIYQAAGITIPRNAQAQYNACKHIPESEARPGDLIFFTGTYDAGAYITHVGVYTGNNQFFHAGGTKCQFSDFTGYYREHFVSFGRM